jgi:hypothetical protein
MGLITAALGGAGEGLEKGSNLAGGLYLKSTLEADRERLAEEAKSQREERNLRLASSLKREEEAAQPRIIPAGSTVQRQGQPDFQAPAAPEKALTPEQTDKLKAEAEWLRAHAAQARAAGTAKEPKPTFPKLMKANDEGVFIDQNTNALGTLVPAVPGTPAEHNWIFPDKPEIQGKPTSMVWNVGGQIMNDREYNQRFYGGANPVSGREGAPGAPKAAPQPAATRPPLSSFFGTQKAATPTAAGGAPAGTRPAALPVEQFLTRQRGGFMFQASPRSSPAAKQLNGRTFASPQDAQTELDRLTQGM